MLTHDAVLRTAYASAHTRAFDEGYRILFALPIYHVFGYVEATVAVVFAGGAICPKPMFDADDMLSSVARYRIDEMMAVPAMTTLLLEQAERSRYDLRTLTTVFSSGAAHRPGMFADMRRVLGAERLFTAYGQTETTASTMCVQPGDSLETLQTTLGCHKPAGRGRRPGARWRAGRLPGRRLRRTRRASRRRRRTDRPWARRDARLLRQARRDR